MSSKSDRPLRVLIVDDEAPARRRLARMLGRLPDAPKVEIAAEASDGLEALERLADTPALDLAFLDIDMPGLDGLRLARLGLDKLPKVVFVTAHNEHALAAFEVGAIDYLLKPVTKARLAQTLDRVQAQLEARAKDELVELVELRAALARLTAPAPAPATTPVRVAVREGSTTRLIPADRIEHLWAADKYTAFIHEGREQLLDESLSELELRLGPTGFVRVHRKALVNLEAVTALYSEGGRVEVELRSGARVDVSRRMAGELRRRLGL